MARDIKSARFVVPCSSVGLDEVTVRQNAASRQGLEAAGVHARHSFRTAEIMQCPGRYDGMGLPCEAGRPGLVHEISFGQSYARSLIAEIPFRDFKEGFRKVETFVLKRFVAG